MQMICPIFACFQIQQFPFLYTDIIASIFFSSLLTIYFSLNVYFSLAVSRLSTFLGFLNFSFNSFHSCSLKHNLAKIMLWK